MNAGIDYGMGQSNIDLTTGIRYGVIPLNDLMPEAADDIFTHGEDVGFAEYVQETKDELAEVIADCLDNRGADLADPDEVAAEIVDMIEWRDVESSGPYEYEGDGYQLRTMSDNSEIFVLRSPFYTHAQFCSPCAPGAGYLPNYCPDGPKTYCLGPDWFDKEGPPYVRIYRVSDDSLVYETPVVEE